jgi:hypothetical protein
MEYTALLWAIGLGFVAYGEVPGVATLAGAALILEVMPELDWAWGYPYGLALIAASALAPALYFKLKGWF